MPASGRPANVVPDAGQELPDCSAVSDAILTEREEASLQTDIRCHSVGPHSFKPCSLEPYPLSRIPLGRIPSGRIPLGRIPISRCPLIRVPFSRTSLISLSTRLALRASLVVAVRCF